MLKPQEILDAASRKWPAALQAEALGESSFPLRIPFGRPRPTADFAVLRTEIEALARQRCNWRIEWEEIETRKWGRQRWPVRLEFDSIEDLATSLGRGDELRLFRAALQEARERCPALEPWLRIKAHRIIDYLADWHGLVAVCTYFEAHPQPRCFPRQLPLPVGTKFIEERTGILRELLDTVLGDAVNAAAATFPERFHLLASRRRCDSVFSTLVSVFALAGPSRNARSPSRALSALNGVFRGCWPSRIATYTYACQRFQILWPYSVRARRRPFSPAANG
jgi:hypothetical protein